MRQSKDQRVREAVKWAIENGWTIRNGIKHPVLKSPNGFFTKPVPMTPSDRRSSANFESQLKAAHREDAKRLEGEASTC